MAKEKLILIVIFFVICILLGIVFAALTIKKPVSQNEFSQPKPLPTLTEETIDPQELPEPVSEEEKQFFEENKFICSKLINLDFDSSKEIIIKSNLDNIGVSFKRINCSFEIHTIVKDGPRISKQDRLMVVFTPKFEKEFHDFGSDYKLVNSNRKLIREDAKFDTDKKIEYGTLTNDNNCNYKSCGILDASLSSNQINAKVYVEVGSESDQITLDKNLKEFDRILNNIVINDISSSTPTEVKVNGRILDEYTDVAVSGLYVPPSARPGGKLKMYFEMYNYSNLATGPFEYGVDLIDSETNMIVQSNSFEALAQDRRSGLAADGKNDRNWPSISVPLKTGRYKVKVKMDYKNNLVEFNEKNNTLSSELIITEELVDFKFVNAGIGTGGGYYEGSPTVNFNPTKYKVGEEYYLYYILINDSDYEEKGVNRIAQYYINGEEREAYNGNGFNPLNKTETRDQIGYLNRFKFEEKGEYKIVFIADNKSRFEEKDENNNTFTLEFVVEE